MRFINSYMSCLPVFCLRMLLLLATTSISTMAIADPGLIEPSANSPLIGTTKTFSWSSDGTEVNQWWLYVGTSTGAADIVNSNNLGTDTQYTVTGLPVDGTTVYVRLWYKTPSQWRFIDTTHMTAKLKGAEDPSLISPANGSALIGSTVEFEWRDNNTPVVYWWLYIGTRAGANDVYDSGATLRGRTSVTVGNLPVDGTTVHVRLWYRTAGSGWQFIDSVHSTSDDVDDGAIKNEAENLDLIMGRETQYTRNTQSQLEANRFLDDDWPDISLSEYTLNEDIYNERLLNTDFSGYFRVKCEVSHFAYDDPIVYPNQPGRAHLHMFFGNSLTNAFSTFDSLMNSGTGTCNGEALNRTAYWVPALLDNQGNALIPDQIMVYYKNDNFLLTGQNDPQLVNPFPENLRMIAGNGGATSPQEQITGGGERGHPVISFSCGPAYNADVIQALIPDCGGGINQLEMQISFPQCVNEEAGTYLADQSHTSYSEGGYYGARCPDSHPTDISSIMYRIFFRTDEYGGELKDLYLSSDVKMDRILPGGTTAHADWFGAWHPEAMDLWVENCNNTQADCETGLLSRDPALSLVLREPDNFDFGYKVPARELVKLCPGKEFDENDPLRSVAMCRTN